LQRLLHGLSLALHFARLFILMFLLDHILLYERVLSPPNQRNKYCESHLKQQK
jgi:hypothetical protein